MGFCKYVKIKQDTKVNGFAVLVDKSEANCRKLISRARGKLGVNIEEPISTEAASEEWVRQFLLALEQGNIDNVISMLAEDVILVSDGGGKAPAALHPIESSDHVARVLLGLIRKTPTYAGGVHIELSNINGQVGLVIRSNEGVVAAVLMHIASNVARNLYFVWNPDKLGLLLKIKG